MERDEQIRFTITNSNALIESMQTIASTMNNVGRSLQTIVNALDIVPTDAIIRQQLSEEKHNPRLTERQRAIRLKFVQARLRAYSESPYDKHLSVKMRDYVDHRQHGGGQVCVCSGVWGTPVKPYRPRSNLPSSSFAHTRKEEHGETSTI